MQYAMAQRQLMNARAAQVQGLQRGSPMQQNPAHPVNSPAPTNQQAAIAATRSPVPGPQQPQHLQRTAASTNPSQWGQQNVPHQAMLTQYMNVPAHARGTPVQGLQAATQQRAAALAHQQHQQQQVQSANPAAQAHVLAYQRMMYQQGMNANVTGGHGAPNNYANAWQMQGLARGAAGVNQMQGMVPGGAHAQQMALGAGKVPTGMQGR
jgi:hypothetical protein